MNNPDLLSVASDLAGYGDDKELAAAGRAYVLSELRGATRAAPGPTCAEALLRLTVGVVTSHSGMSASDWQRDSVMRALGLLDHLRAAGFKCPACKGKGDCESLFCASTVNIGSGRVGGGEVELNGSGKNDAVVVSAKGRSGNSHGSDPLKKGSDKPDVKADTSTSGAFSTKAKRKAKA